MEEGKTLDIKIVVVTVYTVGALHSVVQQYSRSNAPVAMFVYSMCMLMRENVMLIMCVKGRPLAILVH